MEVNVKSIRGLQNNACHMTSKLVNLQYSSHVEFVSKLFCTTVKCAEEHFEITIFKDDIMLQRIWKYKTATSACKVIASLEI